MTQKRQSDVTSMKVLINIVRKGFAEERAALGNSLRGDPLTRRFFEPLLSEEVSAVPAKLTGDVLYSSVRQKEQERHEI